MNTRLTLFKAVLVQDSALSVSGLDRDSSADHPFAMVNGQPILVGRGLKGAAVSMARRFFDPLPRCISEDSNRTTSLRRSAWEFTDATPLRNTKLRLRSGVGIRHKTGARVDGVLYDHEVVPSGTKWTLTFRVDWSYAADENEAIEAEGILGYILSEHWKKARCWLGGGVARGLGWCHIEELHAYRFDQDAYKLWLKSERQTLPPALQAIPTVEPTRSWFFRTRDVKLSFGEYKPEPEEAAWGLDMFAIGPHDSEKTLQFTGDGKWGRPSWVDSETQLPDALMTDRSILMERDKPLLPGASLRGSMRHAFSRLKNSEGKKVKDPHLFQGDVGEHDLGGRLFGTVAKSSRVIIRDGLANGEWSAAKLHMHAEDEFSASSYGSSKRDAVRVLKGTFPTRIVVEGPTSKDVESLVGELDHLIELGKIGHLPVGGHKTKGAGWGLWKAGEWKNDDVKKARDWTPPIEEHNNQESAKKDKQQQTFIKATCESETYVRVCTPKESWDESKQLTLATAIEAAQKAFAQQQNPVAWWCDPTIDLRLSSPPVTFGKGWPQDGDLQVDEVAFYSEKAVWRAAKTAKGVHWVFIQEVDENTPEAKKVDVISRPARLHKSGRFSAAELDGNNVLLREWYADGALLGFTIEKERN